MRTTDHRAVDLTPAVALAMWEAATSNADKIRAGAAMAEVLRASLERGKS